MTQLKCKVCGLTNVNYIGHVDPNKDVLGRAKTFILKNHNDLHFYKCEDCGFLYTPYFDNWTQKEFEYYIYNDEYILIDPDYTYDRPKRTADWFVKQRDITKHTRILDFGAGSAVFEKVLKEHYSFTDITSWDPFWHTDISWHYKDKFDVITAFEVFEHTTDPVDTLMQMIAYLKPATGRIIISTITTDIMPIKNDLSFWYIAPRNGHVCMHSNKSLEKLFEKVNMHCDHINNTEHIAYFK